MIYQTLTWNPDMAAAPRGETVSKTTSYLKAGKAHERVETEFVPVVILALAKSGKVYKTYWVPEKLSQGGVVMRHGHWSGFAEAPEFRNDPIAWAAWPDGVEVVAALAAIDAVGDFEMGAPV